MIGVVLAGGASRRMGRPKHEVKLGDRTMVQHVTDALGLVCDRVVISGARVRGFEDIPDPVEHEGPLVGVVSALHHLQEPILAVGVDQPWVRPATLRELVETATERPVVPVDGGVRQVTCAIYTPGFLDVASSGVSSIQTVLARLEPVEVGEASWRPWGEDGRSWFSVDTEQELEAGVERFGLPGRSDG